MTSRYRSWTGPAVLLSDREIWALTRLPDGLWRLVWVTATAFCLFQLAGCAGPTQQDTAAMARDPRIQLMAACQGYVSALNVATAAISADKMSASNVMRVVSIRDRVGPMCSAQDKQTPDTALVVVAQATTDLETSVGAK